MSSRFHMLRATATAVGVALCASAAHAEKGAREAALNPSVAKAPASLALRDQAALQRALRLYSQGDYTAAATLLDTQFIHPTANAQRSPEELLQALAELRLRARNQDPQWSTGFEQQVMLQA